MSKTQTEDELLRESQQFMGAELGELHFLLCRELAYLHLTWREYRALFARDQETFNLMNATAPRFFKRLNDSLWHATLLHLCRLTDPPDSVGKPNLTVRRLVATIDDSKLKEEVEHLALQAKERTEFARDWRNRHLAHRDLNRAKSPQVHPLSPASRADVEGALAALRDIMNRIERHYRDSEISYADTLPGPGGVDALFYFLRLGSEAEEVRKRKLRADSVQ